MAPPIFRHFWGPNNRKKLGGGAGSERRPFRPPGDRQIVIILRIHHILSDEGGDEGPHMTHDVGQGEAPGAMGGGEQLRGVHVQDLQWKRNYTMD